MSLKPHQTCLLPADAAGVARAAAALRDGALVAMPTETVYGLAADALDPAAVARIFAAKDRPSFDPLIVHVSSAVLAAPCPIDALAALGLVDAAALSPLARDAARRLTRALWPGPLTLVLPRGPAVPDLVTAGLATVAVRAPAHPIARALIDAARRPLAAPSANRFGRISPTRAEHVRDELDGRLPFILDAGPCLVGIESTILALDPDGGARLLRPGGASVEAIEAALGAPLRAASAEPAAAPLPDHPAPDDARAPLPRPAAPGMLTSHYAPRRPLRLLPAPLTTLDDATLLDLLRARGAQRASLGVLLTQGPTAPAARRLEALTGRPPCVHTLSARGDWSEAAQRLFATLRVLDAAPVDALFAEPAPSSPSLARAIGDRLRRASAPRPDDLASAPRHDDQA